MMSSDYERPAVMNVEESRLAIGRHVDFIGLIKFEPKEATHHE